MSLQTSVRPKPQFGLGPIPIQEPKSAYTFGQYGNQYRNHLSKGESSYRYYGKFEMFWNIFEKRKALVSEKIILALTPIPKLDYGFGSRYRNLVSVVHYFRLWFKKIVKLQKCQSTDPYLEPIEICNTLLYFVNE